MEQVLSNKNDKSSNGNGVLVQCIQVTYKKTPVYSLRQYFRQFGAFRNFETAYDLNPQQLEPIKRLLITYVEQEAARRVLLNESHFVENEIVNVKSTNSRQELVKENVCETERENLEIAHTREKAFNILQLPEFCIHAILERMAPGDQIRFVQSHRSFQTIFETFSRRKYKKFIWNKTQSMTMGEIRDFLSIAGKYMVELNGEIRNRYYDDVMNLLIVYCPNFEKVTLSDIYINPDSFRNFLRGLPNLRELNLTYYQLDERAFAALRDAKKLRVLKLSNMFHIRGEYNLYNNNF
ncbi:unnamed protein product [Ceratitis capitata]|uniref:(Mediterranean fruit fly) hypothetical protein n=1 Tax=Ceratitis capitata TaxID=7213 RepID=A0A811VDT8_CERCA|nr:unnamed protein product [Ceratitis capitata]